MVVAIIVFTSAHGFGPGAYNSVQLLSIGLSGLLYAGLLEAAHMARNGYLSRVR